MSAYAKENLGNGPSGPVDCLLYQERTLEQMFEAMFLTSASGFLSLARDDHRRLNSIWKKIIAEPNKLLKSELASLVPTGEAEVVFDAHANSVDDLSALENSLARQFTVDSNLEQYQHATKIVANEFILNFRQHIWSRKAATTVRLLIAKEDKNLWIIASDDLGDFSRADLKKSFYSSRSGLSTAPGGYGLLLVLANASDLIVIVKPGSRTVLAAKIKPLAENEEKNFIFTDVQ